MKNIAIYLILPFLLTACGVSIGPDNAVRNATIGELMIATKLSKNASIDDFENMLGRLRVAAPFNVDRTLGYGLDKCDGISNVRTSMSKIGSDANQINLEFDVDKKSSVEFIFIGRSSDILFISMIQRPLYLMGVKVKSNNKIIFSDDGASTLTFDMLTGLSVNCELNTIVQKQIEAIRIKEVDALSVKKK